MKNPLRLGKNSDDRFSDFMLSENLACEVVCAETNSVFAEEIWSERRKSCQNHHFETMRIQCFGQGSCFWQLQVQEQPYSIEEKLIIKF